MENIQNIELSRIVDPAAPMRVDMDRDALFELAESIKREGLINPITVRPIRTHERIVDSEGTAHCPECADLIFNRYEVVAGHRRTMASRIAGLASIPCVVRELTDEQAVEIMAHENLERQDLDVVEEALFLGRLIGEDDTKISDTAKRMNRTPAWVESRLEILQYPDYMIQPLRAGTLKLGVAHWLFLIGDDGHRKQYVDNAVVNGMTILQAQYIYNLWAAGALQPLADLIPPPPQDELRDVANAQAPCARCGKLAVHPNLQNVFIHNECPEDDIHPPPQNEPSVS